MTVVTQCFSFCPKHFDADIAEYEVSYCHDSTVVEYLDTEKNYHTNPIFEEKKKNYDTWIIDQIMNMGSTPKQLKLLVAISIGIILLFQLTNIHISQHRSNYVRI